MLSKTKLDRQKVILLLAVWTAFGVFFGTQNYIRDAYFGKPASLPGYIISWILCGYSWGILTLPVLRFAGRFSLKSLKWPRCLVVHIPASAFFALLQLGIYLVIASLLFRRGDRSPWEFYKSLLVNEFQSSVLVYFAILSAATLHERFFRTGILTNSSGHANGTRVQSLAKPSVSDSNGAIRRIPIKENGKIVLVDAADINWIESYGNYVFIHTRERRFIYRETVAAMEKKLDGDQFLRIRRSTIVKIDQIKELHPTANGEFEIVLHDGKTLAATRRYRKNLERVLKS